MNTPVNTGAMTRQELVNEVLTLRQGIADYINAKGNDACWENRQKLAALVGLANPSPELPPEAEFLENCAIYYHSYPPVCRAKEQGQCPSVDTSE